MALLNKIFSSRKKNQKQGYVSFGKNESVSWKPFSFNKDQVRVILFRECDWRGRKLLFDSETVQKTAIEAQQVKTKFGSKQKSDKKKKNETFVEITNGFGYQYLRPNQDVTVMGEMIFGSVAMSFKGTAFKVHVLKSPERLMCTKVFQSPGAGHRTKKISDHSLEDSYSSSISSVSDGTLGLLSSSSDLIAGKPGSGPLDVPYADLHSKMHYSSLEADSGFCGDTSLQSPSSVSSVGQWPSYTGSITSRNSSGSVDGVSGGSLASLRRRWLRSVSTSLEVACSASSGLFSSRNSSSSETSSSVGTSQRRTKLGLAMVIALSSGQEKDMETFLLEHMAILESMIERLQLAVDRAYLRKDMFVHLMMEAWEDLCQWLEGLISAPRPSCPLWMGLGMAPTPLHTNLAYGFLQDLCHLIAALDTKANNFFVSTLITAVLTHHLGWVATVMPDKSTFKSASRTSCSSQLLNSLSRSHPYSALWAQLGDLSGAICSPTKVARTIVTSSSSKQTDLVGKIVSCLTYFIRCGALEKHSNISLPSEIFVSDAQCAFDGSPLASMKSSAVSVSTLTEATSELHLRGAVDELHMQAKTLHRPADKLATPFNVSKHQLNEKRVDIAEDDIHDDSKVAESEETAKRKGVVRELFKIKSAATFSCEVTAGNMCSPARAEWDSHEVSSLVKKCDSDNSDKSPAPVITYSQTITSDCNPEPSVPFHRGLSTESSRTLTENSLQNTVNVCGMKRSTSFCNRLTSSLAGAASVAPQLHPTATEIEVLEDSVNNNALHPEVISEKVSRLCRIPAEAVMYHLQKECSELEDSSRLLDRVSCERQMSAVDVNKPVFQFLTPIPRGKLDSMVSFESHINNSSYDCTDEPDSGIDSHIGSANTKSESVIFILGDNEQLVGLKNNNEEETRTSCLNLSHQEENKADVSAVDSNGNINTAVCDKCSVNCCNSKSTLLSRDSCSCTGFTQLVEQERSRKHGCLNSHWKSLCNCDICKIGNRFVHDNSISWECKTSRKSLSCNDSPFTIPSVKTECGASDSLKNWDSDRASLIDSNCEGRIVTVHSSYIELEDEGDCRESRSKSVMRPSKPVTRSQSLSFPLCKKPSSKQSSIYRRHSEYVHRNERYLKNYHSVRFNFERCERVLNNYVDGTGQEKTPEEDEINGARENFENLKSLSEEIHCRQCGNNKVSSANVSSICSLCGCKSVETCASDNPVKHRAVNSRPTYVDTDVSREGNALFDDYSALSDEDVVTPTGNMTSSVKDDENCQEDLDTFGNKTFLELPFPSNRSEDSLNIPVGSGMAASLLGGVTDHYLPDLILHGCIQPVRAWESALRRDLALYARHPPVDQEVSEAVCIVANTDSWDVQLLSSHAYVTDRPGTLGVHVGMSQLVANMLESLLFLWKLHTPVDQCLKHVESKLRELYLRSQAVAEMLLSVDFCDVATLTSALGLEANDIPLLLAVASTHSPQVTQRYGISFR